MTNQSLHSWLHQSQPGINIIVEPEVAEQFQKELPFVHVIETSKPDQKNNIVF